MQGPMDLYGRALMDFHNGDSEAVITLCREDGCARSIKASVFFREANELEIDRIALDQCRGRVLDVGAGTGVHSLALQHRGLMVCAIDVSSLACEVMQRRGVSDVRCADAMRFCGGPFDTILILGRSICMTGDLNGLRKFLVHAKSILRPDGQVLLNSMDATRSTDAMDLVYQEANRKKGKYFGESLLYFQYKQERSPDFRHLNFNQETLESCAKQNGLDQEILFENDDGDFLARLTISKC